MCVMASRLLGGMSLGIEWFIEPVLSPAAETSVCPRTFLLTRRLLSYFDEIHMGH